MTDFTMYGPCKDMIEKIDEAINEAKNMKAPENEYEEGVIFGLISGLRISQAKIDEYWKGKQEKN